MNFFILTQQIYYSVPFIDLKTKIFYYPWQLIFDKNSAIKDLIHNFIPFTIGYICVLWGIFSQSESDDGEKHEEVNPYKDKQVDPLAKLVLLHFNLEEAANNVKNPKEARNYEKITTNIIKHLKTELRTHNFDQKDLRHLISNFKIIKRRLAKFKSKTQIPKSTTEVSSGYTPLQIDRIYNLFSRN